MWRSRSLEEWERKKSYLIRSLFENVSISSTIFEGHESASLSFPSNFDYGAESPLPELIIELEPKKPNLHDDPEELYDALAKEMRRLYRKDFLDIEFSTSHSENSSSEILNRERVYDNVTSDEPDSDEAIGENSLKEKCVIDYDATEHQIDHDTDSPIPTERSNSEESSETVNVETESLISEVHVHSKEYKCQEKLSREQQGFTESKQYRLHEGDLLNVSKTTNVIASIRGGDDDTEERSDSENIDVHSQEYEIQENLPDEQQEFTESKQYRLHGGDLLNVSKTTNVISSIQGGDDDTEERSDSENIGVHSQEYETQENLPGEQQEFTESKQYSLNGGDPLNVSKITNVIASIQGGDDDTEERSDSESLAVHSQEYEIPENLAAEQLSGKDSPNVMKTVNIIGSIPCGDDDTEKLFDSEIFAKGTNASSSRSSSSSINSLHASPEIMRQRQPFVSSVTPPNTVHIRTDVSQSKNSVSKTIHLSMEVDSKDSSENVLTSNEEIAIAEGTDNETFLFVSSTPTRKRKSRFSMQRGQKRRLVSYSSSSLFASVANAASQTSFSDCETDWCNFWSNFFVGMPTVYNVCSCNEHICTT